MLRPLPPFRIRPLKKATIRKAPHVDLACEVAEEDLVVSIKGLRRPLKLSRPAVASRLRVLSRDAGDQA